MATKVIEVDSGKLTVYPCDYDSYLYIKSKKQDLDSPFAALVRGFKPKADKAEPAGNSQGPGQGVGGLIPARCPI